ncbi:MAG: hypothetical protein AB7P40_25325 [Chloroflexota bacterium]
MNLENLSEMQTRYVKMMETIPAQAYLSAAGACMGLSVLLKLLGKKDSANFVGQWPTTILLAALVYKLLRPSKEAAFEDGEAAVEQATRLITASH